jgi:hypothetical protein
VSIFDNITFSSLATVRTVWIGAKLLFWISLKLPGCHGYTEWSTYIKSTAWRDITKISEKEAERHFEDTRSSRRYNFGYVLVFVSLLVFLTVFLVFKDVELYKEVFKLLIVYLGGLGSGIGINQWVGRKS